MSKTLNTDNRPKSGKKEGFAFGRLNYILLIAGIVTIAIGYLLMVGGGTDNLDEFNKDAIFHLRRITLSPIVIVIGFIIILVAIMKKPKATSDNS